MNSISLIDFNQLIEKDYWTSEVVFIALSIIGFSIVPYVVAYLTSKFTEIPINIINSIFGKRMKLITGCIGIWLHKLSHIALAIIGCFRWSQINKKPLFKFNFDSNEIISYVDQEWIPRGPYQKFVAFWIGIIPFFVTSWFLLTVQNLFSGHNIFKGNTTFAKSLDINKVTMNIKYHFFDGLDNLFSTSNLLLSILFILIIIVTVVYGYGLSNNDLLLSANYIIYCSLVVGLITIGFSIFFKSMLIASLSVTFINLVIFFFWRALIYLVISIVIIYLFKVLEVILDKNKNN